MMEKHQKSKARMNEGLCPDEFEICVPRRCKLLGPWDHEEKTVMENKWKAYVTTLSPDGKLPPKLTEDVCCTWEGEPAWKLRGKWAIAHAVRVHERIHRQVLSLEQVSAVDVGFAILERQTAFRNFLTIRIHVNRKRTPEELVRAGLASFTDLAHLPLRGLASEESSSSETKSCDDDRKNRYRKEWKQRFLEMELEQKQKILGDHLGRYPINSVHREDLSLFIPPDITELSSLDDLRLCICGVPIDIVNAEYGPAVAYPDNDAGTGVFVDPSQRSDQLDDDESLLIGRGKVNPLVGGVSIGSVSGQAGTLGAVVWDRTDGAPCVLSNWHVLAGSSAAQIGQPTFQPALFDGGTRADEIARLKRWRLNEEGDAAIAELSGQRHYASGEILGLWHPIAGHMKPRLNMEIRKWGRSTGFTQGFVDGIQLATNINYGNDVVRFFRNQFHIAPLHAGENVSQVGDSGSVVVTSYRPIHLEDNLATAIDWLRRGCNGQGVEFLCKEITHVLKGFLCKCQRECQDLCTLIKVPDCESKTPDDLCQYIKNTYSHLKCECRNIRGDKVRCMMTKQWLERFYKEHCQHHNCDRKALNDAANAVLDLHQWFSPKKQKNKTKEAKCEEIAWIKPSKFSDFQEAGMALQCENDTIQNPLDICDLIRESIRQIDRMLSDLDKCARLCSEAEALFKKWHGRYHAMSCDQEFFEALCLALNVECDNSTCADISGLIRCIKESVSNKHLTCQKNTYSKPKPTDKEDKADAELTDEECKNLEVTPEMVDSILKELKCRIPDHLAGQLLQLKKDLPKDKVLEAILNLAEEFCQQRNNEEARSAQRVYYAVGMIFAGDTPGSAFGEFAVASDISRLAKDLRFSLRPIFEPRSSFRRLRRRSSEEASLFPTPRSGGSLTPGVQSADVRGGGPQPDIEPAQPDSGNSG